MTKIKLTGTRSVETKAMRLACELREDGRRVRADYEGTPVPYRVAADLDAAALLLDKVASLLRRI